VSPASDRLDNLSQKFGTRSQAAPNLQWYKALRQPRASITCMLTRGARRVRHKTDDPGHMCGVQTLAAMTDSLTWCCRSAWALKLRCGTRSQRLNHAADAARRPSDYII
jgi:hypothetical protein